MKYSEIALKVLAAKECGIIKSNAQFWNDFSDKEQFEKEVSKNNKVLDMMDMISSKLNSPEDGIKMVCIFDNSFPIINRKVKNDGEKPYLLFYKGNLSLLGNLNKNVAVIGLKDPDKKTIKRGEDIVRDLVENDLVIVSGLALGCDEMAHKACLESNGKTIATLPSQLYKIHPAQNRGLAEEIVNKGGLLISEYYKDAISKNETINRFVERDRLQAMFSKAVILIASYRKGEGDSGSRHAMEAARKYEIKRYVMYNSKTDRDNKQFGLNRDLVDNEDMGQVKILQTSSIDHIKSLENPNLSLKTGSYIGEQLTIL